MTLIKRRASNKTLSELAGGLQGHGLQPDNAVFYRRMRAEEAVQALGLQGINDHQMGR